MTGAPAQRTSTGAARRLALRGVAVAIALLALWDPSIVIERNDRALVSVISGVTPADSMLAGRVASAIGRDFAVVPLTLGAADAVVITGERVPAEAAGFVGPAFAVIRDTRASLAIERLSAPRSASVDAAATVSVTIHARGLRGRSVVLSLLADGVVVDRISRTAVTDDDRISADLSVVFAGPGSMQLRVVAGVPDDGVADAATADHVVDVVPRRWNVLVHDGRPSWMSTFVRRAMERDARFVVTSRTVTSTNVATDAGSPPPRLDDARVRESYDVIVVGAPDALQLREVAALDDFLRRRGGAVVLLLDARKNGEYDRITGASDWTLRESGAAVQVRRTAMSEAGAPDTVALRAAELAWPAVLPSGAETIASDSSARPVIWSVAVGAGHLVVSGALDAWRYRDRSQSAFDEFWTGIVAAEAARAVPPLDVRVTPSIARPGERIEVSVTLRDAALSVAGNQQAASSGPIEATFDGSSDPVRLVPDGSVGRLVATLRAPAADGQYRFEVRGIGRDVSAPLVVRADANRATGRLRDALDPWIATRRGAVLTESELSRLAPALRAAISPPAHAEPWHPMRSPWWILPFALLLSAEWWLRRRRVLP
ncbi:MAG: hypothetical protein O2973_13235 [Gemmatimonadetes bacterium]|nr:hypothetical protein [Gemmatimonadota bacterium]